MDFKPWILNKTSKFFFPPSCFSVSHKIRHHLSLHFQTFFLYLDNINLDLFFIDLNTYKKEKGERKTKTEGYIFFLINVVFFI